MIGEMLKAIGPVDVQLLYKSMRNIWKSEEAASSSKEMNSTTQLLKR
jgi:hypothetical protein